MTTCWRPTTCSTGRSACSRPIPSSARSARACSSRSSPSSRRRELEPYLALLALRSSRKRRGAATRPIVASVPWGAGLCVTRPVALAYGQLVEQLDTRRPARPPRAAPVRQRRRRVLLGRGADRQGLRRLSAVAGNAPDPGRALDATSYLLRLVHDSTFSNTVSDYLVLGSRPCSAGQRWKELLRLPLRALRRGPFALRMDWACLRGADRARALIERQRLRPLFAIERRS